LIEKLYDKNARRKSKDYFVPLSSGGLGISGSFFPVFPETGENLKAVLLSSFNTIGIFGVFYALLLEVMSLMSQISHQNLGVLKKIMHKS
jgi:hypothetical protein